MLWIPFIGLDGEVVVLFGQADGRGEREDEFVVEKSANVSFRVVQVYKSTGSDSKWREWAKAGNWRSKQPASSVGQMRQE